MLRLRTAQRDDAQLLRALLYEAAFWRSNVARPQLDEALTNPELARYVEGFGRPGDFGVLAEEGAEPLGAAWWRSFQAGAPGYGFVDEATPEISVAVLPGHRRSPPFAGDDAGLSPRTSAAQERFGRGRDGPSLHGLGPPPAQIPACTASALGSWLGSGRRTAARARDA
jgi:hypothetical protein